MKTKTFAVLAIIGAAGICSSAFAQVANGLQSPTPSEIIYLPQLPPASELAKFAAARGMKIVSIHQTGSEEVAAYEMPGGQTRAVAYRVIASAGSETPALAPSPEPPAGQSASTVAAAPYAPGFNNPYGYNVSPAYPNDTYDYLDGYYDYLGYYPWGWYPGAYWGLGYGYGGWWGGYGGRGYGGRGYGGRGYGGRGGGNTRGGWGGHGGGGGHR